MKESTAPIIDLGTCKPKDLNTGKITPEEYFIMYTYRKYLNRNTPVLTLNDLVQFNMKNTKRQI